MSPKKKKKEDKHNNMQSTVLPDSSTEVSIIVRGIRGWEMKDRQKK